jgi:hypothetical protein
MSKLFEDVKSHEQSALEIILLENFPRPLGDGLHSGYKKSVTEMRHPNLSSPSSPRGEIWFDSRGPPHRLDSEGFGRPSHLLMQRGRCSKSLFCQQASTIRFRVRSLLACCSFRYVVRYDDHQEFG